jgi:hypothetical protein
LRSLRSLSYKSTAVCATKIFSSAGTGLFSLSEVL